MDYLPLLVVVFIAWLVPMLLSSLKVDRIPSVLIEIIAGYVAGRFLLVYISPESLYLLDFIALTGLVFIMFLSGLEINVDQLVGSFPRKITLQGFSRNPLLAGILHYLLALLISLAGTFLLSRLVHIPNIWFFSLIPTTTFMGIVYPVLKSRGETRGYYGQTLIITSAVADIMSISLVTITAIYIRYGFHYELLLVAGLFIFSIVFYSIGKKLASNLFKRITFQQGHSATQLNVRGAILVMLVFVAISQYAGPEVVVLGSFISGFVLSFFVRKERSLLLLKLEGIGFGFFIPVFFIMVGAKFNPSSLMEYEGSLYLFLALLLVIFYLVKVLPSFIWLGIFQMKRSMAAGFLLAAHLGLVIAASSVGLELGALTSGANSSFIIMVVITCFLSPLMYNIINKKQKITEDKVVIIGGSSVGVILARRMKDVSKQAVIIEKEEKRFFELKKNGFTALHGDGLDPGVYRKIKLTPDNYVIVLVGSDHENLEICKMLRHDLHHERIISKPDHAAIDKQMELMNIEILDARGILANAIENLILSPTMHRSLIDTFETFDVREFIVTSDHTDGKRIMDLRFHKDSMLLLVRKGKDIIIPHGDTYLRKGDTVTVFGTETALEETRNMLK